MIIVVSIDLLCCFSCTFCPNPATRVICKQIEQFGLVIGQLCSGFLANNQKCWTLHVFASFLHNCISWVFLDPNLKGSWHASTNQFNTKSTGAMSKMPSVFIDVNISIITTLITRVRWAKYNFTFHYQREILDSKGKERQQITSCIMSVLGIVSHPPILCYLWVWETKPITLTQLSGNLHGFFF